jgi:hypothetical protein
MTVTNATYIWNTQVQVIPVNTGPTVSISESLARHLESTAYTHSVNKQHSENDICTDIIHIIKLRFS